MSSLIVGNKVVWAIDPFELNKKFYEETVHLIHSLEKRTKVLQIQPVYVLNVSQFSNPDENESLWTQKYRPAAEKALQEVIQPFKNDLFLLKPHVLVQSTSSTMEATDLLVNYASSVHAGLIIVSTHGRSGMSRLFLGSFAETLLSKSNVPVLVLGPGIQKIKPIDHILFPTEFGSHAQIIFRNVVQLAKELKAQITLFHSIPHPVEPIFQSGVYLLGGSWIPIHPYLGKELDRQNRRAEAWCRWANHQGVEADFVLHSQGGSISAAVLSLARTRNSGMILMEGQSGPISAAILGSITRQVIRSAPCPVWVIRFNEEMEKEVPPETPQKRAA